MAPDITLYYKHVCKKLEFETNQEPSNEDEAMEKMKENVDKLVKLMGDDVTEESNVLPFGPIDKSKLH
jgi:cell division GTPase FtsZ